MDIPVTVVIPSIPPRVGNLLNEAVQSVLEQTYAPEGGISCALDVARAGAARTRQRALDAVTTEYVAFLDDDDRWYPHHLETLWKLVEQGAVYAWSWFDGNNPFPMHRGRQMNLDQPHHTTMTVLVRTDVAKAAGFYQDGPMHRDWSGEDWQFELRCIEKIRELYGDEVAASECLRGSSEVTWTYRVHVGNTSGLTTRW